MPKFKSQGEKIKVFTLMIPEIANQMVKISSASKTCDMSDILACKCILLFSQFNYAL